MNFYTVTRVASQDNNALQSDPSLETSFPQMLHTSSSECGYVNQFTENKRIESVRYLSPPISLLKNERNSRNSFESIMMALGARTKIKQSQNRTSQDIPLTPMELDEADAFSQTAELIVQSPKPRLSGYYRPGLKSSLGSGRSRKSSRFSAPISDFRNMTSATANKTRERTNVEDLDKSIENNKEQHQELKGSEMSVRESQCQIQSTPNRPNKPLNFVKNETSFSRKSTLSNAVTCVTTNSVVSKKGSNVGFLQAFKQNNSSFSRSSAVTNNQSSLCRIGTPSTNNKEHNFGSHSLTSKNLTTQNSSEPNAYSPQRKAPQQFKLQISSQPPSSIAKEAVNDVQNVVVAPFGASKNPSALKPPLSGSKPKEPIEKGEVQIAQQLMELVDRIKDTTGPKAYQEMATTLVDQDLPLGSGLREIEEVQDTVNTVTSAEENPHPLERVQSVAMETFSMSQEMGIKEIPASIANKIPKSIGARGFTPKSEEKKRKIRDNLVTNYEGPHCQTESELLETNEVARKLEFQQFRNVPGEVEGSQSQRGCFGSFKLIRPHRSSLPLFEQLCVLVRANSYEKINRFFEMDPKHFRKMMNKVDEETGNQLIHLATLQSTFDMVDFFLSIGGKVETQTSQFPKQSCLHLGAQRGDISIYSLLLNAAPGLINSQDENGNTPLHIAALARNTHIIEFTLSEEKSQKESILCLLPNKNKLYPQDILRKSGYSMKLHNLAKRLELLRLKETRDIKQKRSEKKEIVVTKKLGVEENSKIEKFKAKLEEIKIHEASATSIDKVFGQLFTKHVQPVVQMPSGDQDLVTQFDSEMNPQEQKRPKKPYRTSIKVKPKVSARVTKEVMLAQSESEHSLVSISASANFIPGGNQKVIWSINSPMSCDRATTNDFIKGLTSPHNSGSFKTLDNSVKSVQDGARLKYLEKRVKTRGIVKSKNALNWADVSRQYSSNKLNPKFERSRSGKQRDDRFNLSVTESRQSRNKFIASKSYETHSVRLKSTRTDVGQNKLNTTQSQESIFNKPELQDTRYYQKSEHSCSVQQCSVEDEHKQEERVGAQDFVAHALLGSGAFGEVYLVEKLGTGEKFAMKVLKKKNLSKASMTVGNFLVKYAVTERNVLSTATHPFIVALHCAFQTNDKLFLILTYCAGGDMCEYLQKRGPLPEWQAKIYIAELILAIEYLHNLDIIFRDLKPENVVIDAQGHVLLTDFGLSKEGMDNESITKTFCGSPAYLAPQMVKQKGHGKAVDWYNLGAFLYEMVCGVPPFFAHTRQQIQELILNKEVEFPPKPKLTSECRALLRGLLEKEPKYRLGGGKGGVQKLKLHPWFKNIKWSEVSQRRLRPPRPKVRDVIKKRESSTNQNVATQAGTTDERDDRFGGWSFVRKNSN